MWYSRVGSSKIQCGVNLLHQWNGENSDSSLLRILANEVDKLATYFQAERCQLDPSFCRKKFNFFHKLIKLELLDSIGKRERQRTQQMYINERIRAYVRYRKTQWNNVMPSHSHSSLFFPLSASFISTCDLGNELLWSIRFSWVSFKWGLLEVLNFIRMLI